MAISRADISKLPKPARDAVNRQLDDGEPLTKERQLQRGGGSRHVSFDGEHWDSQEERQYGKHLALLVLAGEISDLQRQVRVELHVRRRVMFIDFSYYDNRLGEVVWDDYKMRNWRRNRWFKDWKVKADMWAAGLGPGRLRITVKDGQGGYKHDDEIIPRSHPELVRRVLSNAAMEASSDK